MKLFSYIQMFSQFYVNKIKLGRWRNTGLPCDVKMANCSHLDWDDYNYRSNTYRIKSKLDEIPLSFDEI